MKRKPKPWLPHGTDWKKNLYHISDQAYKEKLPPKWKFYTGWLIGTIMRLENETGKRNSKASEKS